MDRSPAGDRREPAPAQPTALAGPSAPERVAVTFAYDARTGTVVGWDLPAAVEDLPMRQGEALRTAVCGREEA